MAASDDEGMSDAQLLVKQAALPNLTYRRAAGTSLHETHTRQVPPAQIMTQDGGMLLGIPPHSSPNSTRAHLDRWMVVLTSPAMTDVCDRERLAYQRLFSILLFINFVVTTVALGFSLDHAPLPTLVTAERRLAWFADSSEAAFAGDVGRTLAASPSEPSTTTMYPTLSTSLTGKDSQSTGEIMILYLALVAVHAWGTFAVWALYPLGLALYTGAITLMFFLTVLVSPTFAFAFRFVFDAACWYVADTLRLKLLPTWFATHQG